MIKQITRCFLLIFSVAIMAFPSPAKQNTGVWKLVNDAPIEDMHPANKAHMDQGGKNRYSVTPTTQKATIYHHQTQEVSTYTCTSTWTSPPAELIPGETIMFNIGVSIEGTPGKSGYLVYGEGIFMYVGVEFWTEEGAWVDGGNLFHTKCEAGIIGKNFNASSECRNLEWTVPGGNTRALMHILFRATGVTGTNGHRYVYKFEPGGGGTPPPPPPPEKKKPNPPEDTGQLSSKCDLALRKNARQSSTAYGRSARRAVDGNTSGIPSDNSITETDIQKEAWWEVDLGTLCQITHLYLWNRTDQYAYRLSNFYLLVSKDPFPEDILDEIIKDPDIWKYKFNGQAPETQRMDVNFQGRYVRIQLIGTNVLARIGTNILSLAEVEVCGWALETPPVIPPEETAGAKKQGETEIIARIIGTKGNCEAEWGNFTVPVGQEASGFRYSGLESGFNCETGEKVIREGFTIHKDDFAGSRVYSYLVNKEGQVFESGGPLNALVLTPGKYIISVDGGYDAEVMVFYKLK